MGLKIPTGGRQTTWLFTSMTKELNWGLSRNNSSFVVRARREPTASGFQVWCPSHSAKLPPNMYFKHQKFHFLVFISGVLRLSFVSYSQHINFANVFTLTYLWLWMIKRAVGFGTGRVKLARNRLGSGGWRDQDTW